ncbi:MAG: recombinase family protein [Eubacterium sp.]|nr:recombinase family protein [Eubacterium sp.]MCM1062031.1 recombinase family protein [Eubacterium sp.]
MSKIGYIRVSSVGQETARQDQLMKDLGVEKVFSEKLSGKTADRPELQNMLKYIREDDVLYVESISRLSRSIRDLLKIVDTLNSKGVKLVSCKEALDTGTPQGRFVLSIFAALAELEREQTLQRQKEGIEIAKAAGVYKGKQFRRIDDKQFQQLYSKWSDKEITAAEFGRRSGLAPSTLYRRINHYQETGKIN